MSADKVDGSHSSSTPGASTVPVTGSNGKLAPGWIPLPTSSSIGGIFMDADCLTGNHVSGIDAASGRLECSADAADWSTLANKPAAFPPDISSQAWQDLLAALALKAPQAALDEKLAISALDSTLIVSKFNGGACAGYLKSDGGCDTPSGSESTPSLDETSVTGSVYSSKPFKVAGTQTDMEVVEGTPVEVAGENHWSVDSATHRPAYSYNGGIASKVAFVGDGIAAENVAGLGDAALKNTGSAAGTVAAGDDSRIAGAFQSSNVDVDGALAANSDAKVASQKATKAYADTKAPMASPTFTGTVSGVTKAMVGLGNVDNTSDASKPVSTATQTALDAKLASSALNATLIVGKFTTGGGACSGYLKNDGTCSTPTGSESTPSLDETTTPGSIHSSKPVEVAGTQTDFKVIEGASTAAAGENHFFFDSADHHPAYSYNGGTPKHVLLEGDASSYSLPALQANTLGGVKGTGSALTCAAGEKVTGFAADGAMQCGNDETSGSFKWVPTVPFASGGTSSGGAFPAANAVKIWGFEAVGSITTTTVSYNLTTADNNSGAGHNYDIAIYSYDGQTLLGHIGPVAGTTFSVSTGSKSIAWTASFSVTAGTRYLIALTTDCSASCAVLQSVPEWQPYQGVAPSSGGTTSGGSFTGVTFTPPSEGWAASVATPNLLLR